MMFMSDGVTAASIAAGTSVMIALFAAVSQYAVSKTKFTLFEESSNKSQTSMQKQIDLFNSKHEIKFKELELEQQTKIEKLEKEVRENHQDLIDRQSEMRDMLVEIRTVLGLSPTTKIFIKKFRGGD